MPINRASSKVPSSVVAPVLPKTPGVSAALPGSSIGAAGRLGEQKPDANTPGMESQQRGLASEATKPGNSVPAYLPDDILTVARPSPAAAPSETERGQGAMAGPVGGSDFVSGSLTTAADFRPSLAGGSNAGIMWTRMAGPTQGEMNIQAGKTLHAAEMNLAAAEALEKFGRTGPLRQLQEAEATRFDAYAESVGTFAASAFQGASLAPLARADAMTNLVKQRTDLVMGRNVEGVVAWGSTGGGGLDRQSDMNQDAGSTLRSAQAQLASVTDRIRLHLASSPRAALFEASCTAFDTYTHAASDTAGARLRGGSLEPLARAGATESLVRERTALLEETLASLRL